MSPASGTPQRLPGVRQSAGLSRRAVLFAAGAALSGGTAPAAGATAWPAEAFVGSVGVCAHVDTGPYHSLKFYDLIGASGIRCLRAVLNPATDFARWRALYATFGIRSHLLVSPATNTVTDMLHYIDSVGVTSVAAIEGQNEGDSLWFAEQQVSRQGWNKAVVDYQREIFNALRQRYSAVALPVVSPTLIDWRPGDVALIRDAAPFCDVVALHSYVQHAEEPETTDDYAALSWYVRNFRDPFKPGAPIMVTETGYTNVVTPGQAGISERAAAIYLPRLLLHNFAAGVLRTFLYEFIDGGASPTEGEHHYGLVRFDGTPKPAYHAIAALLAALDTHSMPAAGLLPAALSLAFSDAPADLRHLVFMRRDRTIIVALWRPLRVWDIGRGKDISIVPRSLVIVPAWNVTYASYITLDGESAWSRLTTTAGKLEVPLGGSVTLCRVETRDV